MKSILVPSIKYENINTFNETNILTINIFRKGGTIDFKSAVYFDKFAKTNEMKT